VRTRTLRRGNWAVQELERLRLLLPRRGVEGTATLLHRSPASVFRKALELLRVPVRRGDWTEGDDARLRESWGAVDPRLLGPMLGRPVPEVKRRAVQLRERLGNGSWTRAEIQLLKHLYGTRSDRDLEVCLLRTESDIAATASRLCLAKDKRFVANTARNGEGLRHEERRAMPRWTTAQIVRLRSLYADHDNLTVAREIGRTVTSVANKGNQLGLKKCLRLLTDIGRSNVAIRYGTDERVSELDA
jgi:hypothetical protein